MADHSIIVWTADFSRTDGQSIVTNSVLTKFSNRILKAFVYRQGVWGILQCFFLYFQLYFLCARSNRFIIYVVVSRSLFGFLRDLPILLLASFSVRLVCHCHGSDLTELLNNRVVGVIARFLYRKCTLIVPSGHLIEELRRFGLSKIAVIENFYCVELGTDDATGTLEF